MPKIPGPWYCLTGDGGHVIIADTVGPHWAREDHWVGTISADNAPLVNAAPELLGALRGALEWLENINQDYQDRYGLSVGYDQFIDTMPNSILGRVAMRLLIQKAES